MFHGGGGRTYVLAADSQEALEVWMKALARASYDYLKLMVAELQKQLDELSGKCPGAGQLDVRDNYKNNYVLVKVNMTVVLIPLALHGAISPSSWLSLCGVNHIGVRGA